MAAKPKKKNGTTLGPALARPGDPLVTAKGEVLQPKVHEKKIEGTAEQFKIAPEKFRGKKQHNVRDLPAPPNVMHAVGAVMMYSIMNVGDREIADQLKCTVEEVVAIRQHVAYQEVFESFFENVVSHNADSIQGRIASYASKAVSKVVHLMDNAQNEKVQFDASKDILDRGGFRPRDVDTKAGMANNTLRIQINRADGKEDLDIQIGTA